MSLWLLLWILVWTILALAGGSLGALAGMALFRHKTRHWSFRLGMPAILILQVVVLLLWSWRGIWFS